VAFILVNIVDGVSKEEEVWSYSYRQ